MACRGHDGARSACRWLCGATALLLALFALDLLPPRTAVGRGSHEARLRAEAAQALLRPAVPVPDLALLTLGGVPLRLESLRGGLSALCPACAPG